MALVSITIAIETRPPEKLVIQKSADDLAKSKDHEYIRIFKVSVLQETTSKHSCQDMRV